MGCTSFLVKYPDGKEALFRLFKTEKGYVMWGPPTAKEVLFKGKGGYDNLFALADSQAREEYANDVFEDVHACSLPEREYKFKKDGEFGYAIKEFNKMYDFSDASIPSYALASRCVRPNSVFEGRWHFNFSLLRVNGWNEDGVGSGWLSLCFDSTGNREFASYDGSYAVRPEAIPKSTMEFVEEGCDGSKEKPWICLGSQDEEETPEHIEECTSQGEDTISPDKEEIMSLIQEGNELKELLSKWLAEMKEYVKNLK